MFRIQQIDGLDLTMAVCHPTYPNVISFKVTRGVKPTFKVTDQNGKVTTYVEVEDCFAPCRNHRAENDHFSRLHEDAYVYLLSQGLSFYNNAVFRTFTVEEYAPDQLAFSNAFTNDSDDFVRLSRDRFRMFFPNVQADKQQIGLYGPITHYTLPV